jgi:hypothetical protein
MRIILKRGESIFENSRCRPMARWTFMPLMQLPIFSLNFYLFTKTNFDPRQLLKKPRPTELTTASADDLNLSLSLSLSFSLSLSLSRPLSLSF